MKRTLAFAAAVLLCLPAAMGWAQELPALTAPKVSTAPVVDGDLSDACWKQAARAANFYLYDKMEPAAVQTQAYICYDDRALYVAFECREPKIQELVTRPRRDDDRVSLDDCVELFLSAGTDGATYYHFIVTPDNARLDQWNRVRPYLMSNEWDAEWTSAARKGTSSWTVEMAVPWYAFAADIGGGKWRVNFCRGKRTTPEEFSSWAFVKGNFHDTRRFGHLTTPEADLSFLGKIAVQDMAVPSYGWDGKKYSYRLTGTVKNLEVRGKRLMLEALDRPFEGKTSSARARTVELGPSQTIPFDFDLVLEGLGDRRVSVRVTDAESGKPVLFATRDQGAFPAILSACLDRNYYSTEKEARAVFYLNIPAAPSAFTASFNVKTEKGRSIGVNVPVKDPSRTVASIPLSRIPLGTHPAVLSVRDAAGNVVASKEELLRREKSPAGPFHEVKTDRDARVVLVDGKPFFPIVLYDVPPSQMKEVKEAGFNAVIFWGNQGGAAARGADRKTPEEQKALYRRYLDAAQEAGILVIEWPANYAEDTLGYGDPALAEKMNRFLKDRLPKVIEAHRDHPALLAYYSFDEPGDEHRGYVAEASRVTRELDPYHPNYVLFCSGHIKQWPESIDIGGLDWYPRFGQARVIECLDGSRAAARDTLKLRVPLWFVPLCERSSASYRVITGAEQRAQTYLALIGGVNGILWWIWPPRYSDNWTEMKKLAAELNAMMPALTTAVPRQNTVHQPREMDDSVQASVRTSGGKVYLITCNAGDIPARADIRVPGKYSGWADVLFEDRKVAVKDGVVSDRFGPYGTHVYVLSGSWPDAGTLTVSVELEKRPETVPEKKERARPEQENLVVDPGFEGDSYWIFTGAEGTKGRISDQDRHGGRRCATIERSTEKGSSLWTGWEVRLQPRTRYLFGCYGKAVLSGGAEAGLYLSGAYPGGEFLRSVTTAKFRDRSPGWDRYLVSFSTREETLAVRPTLFLQGGTGTAWFDDVFLVKASDEAEAVNLLANSSFEKDAVPGWPEHWWTWATLPGYVGGPGSLWGPDDTTAWHGKRSLRMVQKTWPGSAMDVNQGVGRVGISVEGGQDYTLSVYLKADRPGTKVWLRCGYLPPKDVTVDTEWKRYSVVYTPDRTYHQFSAGVTMQSAGTVWVDAMQFERGREPSAYQPGREEP